MWGDVPRCAGVLHVVRDPRDTALSCYRQPFAGHGVPYSMDLEHLAHQSLVMDRLARHWHTTFPGKMLDVHYEDLVRDFNATIDKVLKHCNLPWEEGLDKFHTHQRTVATASDRQVRKKMYTSSIAGWRRWRRELQPLLRALREGGHSQLPPDDAEEERHRLGRQKVPKERDEL